MVLRDLRLRALTAPAAALAPALRDELDRRLAAHHADPTSAISWDEAKAELRRRFAT
jgi:putative addiction module component (TIGR02574 family)